MSSHYTYMVTNKLNGKVYVGSHTWDGEGVDPNYYGSGKIVKQAIGKYGKENFQVEVLYYYDTVEECRKDEERILTEYNVKDCPHSYNLKNSAMGWTSEDMAGENNPMYGRTGENNPNYGRKATKETRKKISENHRAMTGKNNHMYGKHHTEETRKKLSQAQKGNWKNEEYRKRKTGENNPNYGKHLSKETKKKLSESLKGRKFSEEHRQKISESLKGRKFSEETKKKLSESKKGLKHSEEHRQKISESLKGENNPMYGKHHTSESRNKMSQAHGGKPFVAIKDGKVKIFTSQSECSRVLGLYQSSIYQCLLGKRKSTGGYTFKYIEQLESGIYEGIVL